MRVPLYARTTPPASPAPYVPPSSSSSGGRVRDGDYQGSALADLAAMAMAASSTPPPRVRVSQTTSFKHTCAFRRLLRHLAATRPSSPATATTTTTLLLLLLLRLTSRKRSPARLLLLLIVAGSPPGQRQRQQRSKGFFRGRHLFLTRGTPTPLLFVLAKRPCLCVPSPPPPLPLQAGNTGPQSRILAARRRSSCPATGWSSS
jgi:hypothetical protein